MMIRNIDKIGTKDYLLGYESLVGKYYKQDSPFEEFFDSDLKKEVSKRKDKRADVKEKIRQEVEKDYEIPDTKRAEALLNAKAISGYQNDEVTIEGVPEINRSNYDENENLIEK